MDLDVIRAWGDLNEHICPQCGRPQAVHETDRVGDYHAAFWTCTATQALDEAQAKWDAGPHGKTDKTQADRGRHPDRARRWFTYTDAEGLPGT